MAAGGTEIMPVILVGMTKVELDETAWPWRAAEDLAERLYRELREAVARIMREAGEDPGDKDLFRLRCVQVAYSVHANAERTDACTMADCPHWPHQGHCTKPGGANYQNACPVHGAKSW